MTNMEQGGYDFENKNAFVTGASKGLGEQIALRLLQKGVHVIGTSRSDPPESMTTYLDEGQASYEQGDLARQGDQVLDTIHDKHQGYEIFVNNAGAFSPDYFTQLEPAKITGDIELDLTVPLLLHHRWFELYNQRHPQARTPELSINICSISSFYAWPGGTAYQAAKTGLGAAIYGLRAMQQNLRNNASEEVKQQVGPSADLDTRIVAIYPDNIATGLISSAQKDSLYQVGGDALPTEAVVDTVMRAIEGQGNYGKYDDIAILVNPRDPKSGQELKGMYAAFIPIDDETHRPNFSARILEKIGDEDALIKRGSTQ